MAATARKQTPSRRLRAVTEPVNYAYVTCRGPIRHRWDAVGPIADRRRRTTFGTLVTFRCETCGTLRFDIYSRITGELLGRTYDHPADYKTDKIPNDRWRAMWLDEVDAALTVELEQQ